MYQCFKRAVDFTASLLLLIVISPIFVVIMVLVRCQLGSPVFFKQVRCGRFAKEFSIVKFRSMTDKKDEHGNDLPDEERLTKLGRVLRATSLDELPELLNIIKGDMAVIGPRPLPMKYNEYYTERERKRHLVRGGLIPPEVLFHNVQPTWEEQLEYETWYAENVSLKTDLKIILAVFKGLFTRYKNDYGEYVRVNLDDERKGTGVGGSL